MNIPQLYDVYLQYPSVQTDTRKIKKGDLYFALKGPTFDGNAFAQKALDLGASYAIVDNANYVHNQNCILVKDVLDTLQQLAHFHRKQLHIPFIAITGSNGKTTSKELITAVLKQKFRTYATEGNLNNHIGVPLTILKIRNDAQIAVIEMGANHQREIASYCAIAMPDYAVINNCGKAHIEGFGGIEGVRKGKGELYDFIRANGGTIFINTDLDYLEEMAKGIPKRVTYGIQGATYTGTISSNEMLLKVSVKTPSGSFEIRSNLVGSYNLPNVLLAVAVGAQFEVSRQQIKAAIEAYEPDNSRSQFVVKGSNKIILDAYNANPTSMRAAISNFSNLAGKKIIWLGAMKEMGEDEAYEHLELIKYVEQWNWADVILVGQEFELHKGAHKWFPNSELAANYIEQNKPHEALILIKGSRGSKMEKLAEMLEPNN